MNTGRGGQQGGRAGGAKRDMNPILGYVCLVCVCVCVCVCVSCGAQSHLLMEVTLTHSPLSTLYPLVSPPFTVT
jgi:hypothetical protein